MASSAPDATLPVYPTTFPVRYWSTFAPPHWSGFTPPLTPALCTASFSNTASVPLPVPQIQLPRFAPRKNRLRFMRRSSFIGICSKTFGLPLKIISKQSQNWENSFLDEKSEVRYHSVFTV